MLMYCIIVALRILYITRIYPQLPPEELGFSKYSNNNRNSLN